MASRGSDRYRNAGPAEIVVGVFVASVVVLLLVVALAGLAWLVGAVAHLVWELAQAGWNSLD